MAATRGQRIQERCHRHMMWHHFLRRPKREAGVKAGASAAELAVKPAY